MPIPAGFVACRSHHGNVLLHLMKDDQSATVCGRYKIDQILPENTQLATGTPECGACHYTLNTKKRKANNAMGDLDNYTDGSDRQIIRAVAAACGWHLERITEISDAFTRTPGDPRFELDGEAKISIEIDYQREHNDVYTRQIVTGALRSEVGTHSVWGNLENTITWLRSHQRDAWRRRLLDARSMIGPDSRTPDPNATANIGPETGGRVDL